MNLTGGIILFAVLWFMTFLVVLPIGMRSQADAGEVEPGTPASAPAEPMVARKARIATVVAALLWAAGPAGTRWRTTCRVGAAGLPAGSPDHLGQPTVREDPA